MSGSAARAARENNAINIKSRDNMSDMIKHNHDQDGVDRRAFLKCMAWAGTVVLWTMTGVIFKTQTLSRPFVPSAIAAVPEIKFAQLTASNITFPKKTN